MASYDYKYWVNELHSSTKELEKFHEAGDTVIEHYLNTLQSNNTTNDGLGDHKINMFWANIGILKSALYGNPPKPIAAREFQDPEDDVARVAAGMIERLLKTGPNGSGSDMHEAFKNSVEDRLIPGMGQVWMRYDAKVETVSANGVNIQQIKDENVPCDYVHWRDFFYGCCRVWEECPWVARRVWMTPTAMENRFGKEKADKIPLVIPKDGKSYPATSSEQSESSKRGEIYEIWCKATKQIHWISKGMEEMLDEKPDPLQIPGFFPCPKPLVANPTTTKFIGRADYTMVQDQYLALNNINVRLGYLVEACKAVGLYDKTAEGAKSLLNRGVENQLIPVDNWAMFAEKGGLKGVMDWLPVEAIIVVIEKLRETRADLIQQIYELTGISDIMRGVTSPRETYGAQKLKAQYSSSRLQLYQLEVGEFVAGAMNIKANIISKHFQPETIIRKSLVMYTADRQYAQEAVKLIKSSWELMYRVNVSSTQMSIPDYNAEKQARQEFITTMGQYVGQITPALEKAPSAAPFLMKILQWGAASFATSGGVETLFDNYIREVEKQLMGPPPKSPEQMKAEAEAAAAKQQAQLDQNLAKFDAMSKECLAGIEAQTKERIAAAEQESRERIAAIQADTQIEIAEIKQGEALAGEAQDLTERERELDRREQLMKIQEEATQLRIQNIVEAAMTEVRGIAVQHEGKVKESISKAQMDALKKENKESKDSGKSDIQAMQKMHADLMKSVGQVMEGLKGLNSGKGGKKSISITLPDGKTASAQVTSTKE